MRKHLVAFVIVFGWTAGAAAGQTSAAGALVDAFVNAWNTHDVRAFGRLYAEDADWVTVGGERHKGRVAVEGVLAKDTPVGLGRRFFARQALPFGRSIPKMRS
jgi:hypothetical protein